MCAEQPGTSHFDDNLHLAQAESAAAVLDLNRRSVRELRRRGLARAEHFQLGYSTQWDRRAQAPERDVDILFMGCSTDRRLRHLASYAPLLRRWRCRLLISDNSRPNVAGTPGFVGGEEKLALLARSRILLNLHQGDTAYFEWLRAAEAICNGAAIVSERSSDFAPLVAGEELVLGRPEALGHLAQRLLDDEPARRGIADAALARLRDEAPLRAAVERLVAAAEHAAAMPLPVREAGAPRRLRAVAETPAESAVAEPAPQPQHTTSDPSISMLKAATKQLRLDMLDLRRALARERATAELGGPPATLVSDRATPAWAAARARVSVLLTVHNYGHHVETTLDTVATSGFGAVEVVVVDDASSDDSLARVRGWMKRNPRIAALLLRRPLNMGLPHARNAALGFARGEYAFILDADNELYPGGLGKLVAALDGDPAAAFAYGVLEAFDHDGPHSLLGWLPWDPPRLRAANYIDAMALIRCDALRAVGGYTTIRDLHGWEDYDLWCAFAERGAHAVHVPELVARYRLSAHSMLAMTNVSTTAAYSVLAQRHPRLMKGVRPPL